MEVICIPFEVKLVEIHAYLSKWVAPIDPLTNDLSHCVSLTLYTSNHEESNINLV